MSHPPERPPSIVRGELLTGAGVILLLFTTDLVEENAWDYVWPALVILAGLAIVARWSGRTIPSGAREEDVVRSTAVFGGQNLAIAVHGGVRDGRLRVVAPV